MDENIFTRTTTKAATPDELAWFAAMAREGVGRTPSPFNSLTFRCHEAGGFIRFDAVFAIDTSKRNALQAPAKQA